MQDTYGVIWRAGKDEIARGRLELDAARLHLVGTRVGAVVSEEIAYADLARVRVGRLPAERLNGRPSLVLEPSAGAPVAVASIAEPGLIGELASRISALQRANARQRAAVVLPLLPGARAAVEELLGDGPPFDPALLGLERHSVYLSDDEVVFVFEWRGGATLESLLAEPGVWASAAGWLECAAGPPRVAEPAYRWSQPVAPGLDEAVLPPGLHSSAG